MKATITKIHGVIPHRDTDCNEMDMGKLHGAVCYTAVDEDGVEAYFETGLRPDENNAWSLQVVAATQAWRDAGGVIPEYTRPTPEELRGAMLTLTARQFRLGLFHSGTTEDEVAKIISQIADPTERAVADIVWRTADRFERTYPLIEKIGSALGYTPEVIDDLWNYYLTI